MTPQKVGIVELLFCLFKGKKTFINIYRYKTYLKTHDFTL